MEGKLRQSRRSRGLLVLVAAVVVALGATPAAQSTQDQPVLAGRYNDSTFATWLENKSVGGRTLVADSFTGSGEAIVGRAVSGIGVKAENNSTTKPAVYAENANTVGGVAIEGVNHAPNWVAIYGRHDAATRGFGVLGEAPIGIGVTGRGSESGVAGSTAAAAGTGVLAENTAGGTALKASGAVKFSTAGIATVPAGQNQVTVAAGVDITTNTKVLVTQMSGGKKFTFVERNFAADTLTFHLQRTATNNVTLAYFVIS